MEDQFEYYDEYDGQRESLIPINIKRRLVAGLLIFFFLFILINAIMENPDLVGGAASALSDLAVV